MLKSQLLGRCAGFLVLFSPLGAAASDDVSEGIITVSGSASLEVAANLAHLGFGVETQAPTAAEALSANSGLMDTVVGAIRDAGIGDDEISTAQFNIVPVYERQQERPGAPVTQVLQGYRVSNLLNVSTSQLGKVAQVVDSAVAAGANRVDRIQFGLSSELQERGRRQLIELAVNDAKEKATLALEPLRYQIVGVKNMSIAERPQPGPLFAESMRMDAVVGSAPPVFAGEQAVTTSVNVTFLIGPR
jgi:uncharacterized protein YggE